MALNDISLTAGMRNNLISLQSTTTLLNRTQDRLSTGKKVNTALDNPTNFFAAQSHTQRAADLTVRKDGMTEAVQGVQAANKGITAITALIEAAKGLTQAARSADTANRDTLAQQFNTIRSQIDQLALDSGYKGKNFLNTDNLTVLFNENGGSSLTVSGFNASSTGMGITQVTVAVASTTSSAVGDSFTATGVPNVATHSATLAAGLPAGAIASSTYYVGSTAVVVSGGNINSGVEQFTIDLAAVTAGNTGSNLLASGMITITAVYINGVTGAAGTLAAAQASIANDSSGTYTVNFSGVATGTFPTGAAISFDIAVASHMATGSAVATNLTTFNLAGTDTASGLQSLPSGVEVFVDGVYAATGTYTLSTGQIVFNATDIPPSGTVTYKYNTGFVAGGGMVSTNQTVFSGTTALGANQAITSVTVGGTAVATGSYSVTGNTVTFTSGVATGAAVQFQITTTTAAVTGGWADDTGIDNTVNQLNTAINTLRTQSSNLASNLSVVTIRQDFTDGMVNTLLKGADNLTLADMNEEGANMLMLQTRQQLGTTSLKMASDAAQAVLRLF
ncbi:hypothetical protein [Geoanaerobacter pelophilus]|uniref:flagellin N-terminal helical domain-containing protein n=1 Tax=Geoanaerobacter pelophilus TaxID=60036 RepID=UPI002484CB2B|nr:hypothetical protein [Geoanaerobacter pelophilus]